jgi:hypothetical protein
MSDTMLHGVLCMPPELWDDSELDKRQRYVRYLDASRRIKDDGFEIERLRNVLRGLLRFHQEDDDGAELPREYWSPTYRNAVDLAEAVLRPTHS